MIPKTKKIRRGYVPYRPAKRVILKRKYPFAVLMEGDYISPPYPLSERDRVRSAVKYWNKAYDGLLHVSVTPEGVTVGWPKKPPLESGEAHSPVSS